MTFADFFALHAVGVAGITVLAVTAAIAIYIAWTDR